MTYMATWAAFVNNDDPDPIAVAKHAREVVLGGDAATWKIIDLDSGQITVVDLKEERVIPPEQ